MTDAITDYSVEAQPAAEDIANGLSMLDDVARTAMNCDFQSLERARQLIRTGLTKLRRAQ